MSLRAEVVYPSRIAVQWTLAHVGILVLAAAIWPAFWYFNPAHNLPKLMSIAGLFLNAVGATVATLKPPYYGSFSDGGKLQRDCEVLAGRWFSLGMAVVALGFILQAIKEIL